MPNDCAVLWLILDIMAPVGGRQLVDAAPAPGRQCLDWRPAQAQIPRLNSGPGAADCSERSDLVVRNELSGPVDHVDLERPEIEQVDLDAEKCGDVEAIA